MRLRNVAILVIIVAAASAAITKFYFPDTEYSNTEVIKEVVRNDVKTIVKIVERPDGTKETTSETIDKSIKKETSKSEIIIAEKKQWMVDVGARLNLSSRDIYYDLRAQRRIIGPFFAGASISTDKTIGLSVGMEF